MSLAQEAKDAGCVVYELPENNPQIDSMIAPACSLINASGWVFTSESCQGHIDGTERYAWGMEPFLRLTCRAHDAGLLLDLLTQASTDLPDEEDTLLRVGVQLRIFRHHPMPEGWAQFYVNVECRSAYDRNMGILAFEKFGRLAFSTGTDK